MLIEREGESSINFNLIYHWVGAKHACVLTARIAQFQTIRLTITICIGLTDRCIPRVAGCDVLDTHRGEHGDAGGLVTQRLAAGWWVVGKVETVGRVCIDENRRQSGGGE